MTAYLSDKMTPPVAPRATLGQASQEQVAYCSVALSAALTTADTFAFFTLPMNARVISAILKCTDIDTNGSPAVTINVGDAGSATRFFSSSTVGQAGTVDSSIQAAGRFLKTTAPLPVVGSVGVNAATGVAGTLELMITYVVEGVTSTGVQ